MKKFIILLLIISGCKHSLKEERESYIGMSDKTYWRMIRSDVPKDTTIGICFLKNGTYEGYRIIKTSGKRIMSETHHDVKFVESEWSIPNDSTMIFGQNVPYHIVFFTKDSFYLKPIIFDGWILKFYKELDQVSPIDTTISPPSYHSMY